MCNSMGQFSLFALSVKFFEYFFRPPSDGGLMIPPRTLGDVFVKRLVYLFFYFFLYYYYFNYELRGVIGRAMASHAIDPGSNPGHAMYIFFQVC